MKNIHNQLLEIVRNPYIVDEIWEDIGFPDHWHGEWTPECQLALLWHPQARCHLGSLWSMEVVPKHSMQGWKLTGADLRGACLREADLRGVCLYNADLSRAHLHGANLCCANLSGTCLHDAILYGVDLSWADLRGTKLSCAKLNGANLYGADLHEADLRGIDLTETISVEGVNLTDAICDAATRLPIGWKVRNGRAVALD